jgi:5-methylcytosine-specific restriction endonuclease McrA
MWSRNYDYCIKCGKNDTRHMANGLCARCYLKQYRQKNKKRIRKIRKEYYLLNRDLILIKAEKYRENLHFDKKRKYILKRDKFKCTMCGSKEKLVVHHKDKNGRNKAKKEKNNKAKNLVTVCRSCHINLHRKELEQARQKNREKPKRKIKRRKLQ